MLNPAPRGIVNLKYFLYQLVMHADYTGTGYAILRRPLSIEFLLTELNTIRSAV